MRVALRASVRRRPRGSFKADAIHYLAWVRGMPSYRERERDIGCWIAEFGERRRDFITTREIASVLQRWEREGYAASTLNHRRGALMHLWSRLDGQSANNPVSRIPRYKEPHPEPRGLSWADVDRILAAMPERGEPVASQACSAPGFLDSGLTVFASTLPLPARRGHVAPGRGFDSGTSPASTARCTSA